jgi:two-component system, chemotaxis family, CheB/CheR fusion protein
MPLNAPGPSRLQPPRPADPQSLAEFEALLLSLKQSLGVDAARPLHDAASDVGPVARVVVDHAGIVTQVNQRARALFGLTWRDIGRPLHDLELSSRPFELRPLIERAYAARRETGAGERRWVGAGHAAFLELSVVPLLDGLSAPLGVIIHFPDVTRRHQLEETVRRTARELETAVEELQATNDELRSMVEELENSRLGELDIFLEAILSSVQGAVAVVDRDLHVRKWSRRAEDLWGIRADEVLLKNFLNLDLGLPTDRLRTSIGACLTGETEALELTFEATDRSGRPIHVRLTCTPIPARAPNVARGVILLMQEADGKG